MERTGMGNRIGRAGLRLVLGALGLTALAGAAGAEQGTTSSSAALPNTTITQAAQTPAAGTSGTQENPPITIEFVSLPTTSTLAVEPPNTTTTTLRHLNQDSYNQIKVTPDNEHVGAFVVLGDNRGSTEVFAQVLEQASQEKDALFAIHVGNMVSSATEGQYAGFLKQVGEHLKIPLLTVPGGCDLTSGTDSSLYRQIFGWPAYYHFRIGHTAFVMIDNSRPEALDDAQLAKLDQVLARGMALRNRFIFMNRPLLDPRVGGKAGVEAKRAEKLMDLFEKYQIGRIFSGNIPGFYSGTWEGARYYITGGAGAPLAGTDPNHDFYHYLVVRMTVSDVSITVRRVKVAGATPVKNAAGEEAGDFRVP